MNAPRRLGRYELIEQLGQGGMGEVWLARLTGAAGFEKPCLLKSVLPRLSGDPQFVGRFQHEGKVLVHLTHANIAQVLDMGDADGALYIALEYVMGVDVLKLHDAVFRAGGQLPAPLAAWICQQAAEGLAYAHQKHAPDGTPLAIVHRDVSPHNLMVSYDGEVKVIDFGIARSSARTSQTQAQTVLGKIGYMAPEQARGEELDARADQYALGVVLWELLTDQPYVRPGSVGEMMRSMASPELRSLREYRSDLPAELEAVVLRALSPDAVDRFPRTSDFAQELLQVLAQRYRLPNREELGAYVREKCAADWQQHQLLLQRVTGGQRSDAQAPEPARARPPTRPPLAAAGAETRASSGSRSPALGPQAETRPSRPAAERTTLPADTVVSQPPPAARALPDPDATPLVTPHTRALAQPGAAPLVTPHTRALAQPGADALTTDESLERIRARRAPALIIAGVALALGAGLWALLAAQEPRPAEPPIASTQPPAAPGPALPAPAPSPDSGASAGSASAAPPAAPPRPLPLVLTGLARQGRGAEKSYEIQNTSRVQWTGCVAYFPGKRRGAFAQLNPGFSQELLDSRLEPEARAPELVGKVAVRCKQGSGTLDLTQ